MRVIEQTLNSREVAEMTDKEHSKLLRDIRRYEEQFIEANIGFNDFFKPSEYRDSRGRTLPCYRITKKGCEFIAHKLTGTKGTIFTARYINRFHEMEEIITDQPKPKHPWFIRDFLGKKIMLFRDFKEITGIELSGKYTAWKRPDGLVGGLHWNGYGCKCDNEKFRTEYGFDYGEEPLLCYLYLRGIGIAIRAIENDYKDRKKLTLEAKRMILDGLEMVEIKKEKKASRDIETKTSPSQASLQITLVLNQNGIETKIY